MGHKNPKCFDRLITFSDINIPLLMNQYFRINDEFKYERCVLRHTCIIGHSSYLYWEKSSGNGPVLLFAPLGNSALADLRQERDNPVFGPKSGHGYGYEGLVRAYVVCDEPVIPYGVEKTLKVNPGEEVEIQFGIAF